MGCVSATNTRAAGSVQVQRNTEVVTLTLSAYEADFRRSIETRFSDLRGRKWTYVDNDSGEEIRNQEEYQRLCASLKGRSGGRVKIVMKRADNQGPESALVTDLKGVCGVWRGGELVGSGVYVGGLLVLVASTVRKEAISCSFRQDQNIVKIPIKQDFWQEIQDCGLAFVQLNLSNPSHSALLKSISPLPLSVSSQKLVKGKPLTCLHSLRSTPTLTATMCQVAEATKELIVLSNRLDIGTAGSPLLYENGDIAGIVVEVKGKEMSACVPTEKIVMRIRKLKGIREIDAVFPSVTSASEGFEEINLDDIPQDEGKVTIGFITSQPKVQSSQQESSAQFQFDDADLPPMPFSLPIPSTPPVIAHPCAHYIHSIRGGTELLQLAKSDFSVKKWTTGVMLSPTCSFVDTPKGVVVTGGEDPCSRKSWLWTSEGLVDFLPMTYPHAKHCSVYLANTVFVISGEATEHMESIDILQSNISKCPQLPKKRFHAGVSAIGQGALFLAGGYVGPQSKPSRSLLEYRVHTQAWLKVAFHLTVPMAGLGLCFIAPKSLVVLGGKNSQGAASAEAYIIDVQSGMRVASLYLPEAATFTRTHPVRDDDSFLTFSDQTHQFEFDIRRQRFYLLAVSADSTGD